jgi:hypothetical protein
LLTGVSKPAEGVSGVAGQVEASTASSFAAGGRVCGAITAPAPRGVVIGGSGKCRVHVYGNICLTFGNGNLAGTR